MDLPLPMQGPPAPRQAGCAACRALEQAAWLYSQAQAVSQGTMPIGRWVDVRIMPVRYVGR